MHQLGAGVLGPVFRASAPDTVQPIAIKAFHLDLTPELADELADALQQVVEAGLTHPGIVTPLAVGCEGSVPYLAQDYVAAESLDVAMRHYAPAAAERAVPLIYQLAGAVDAAHEAGVLHGSLHLRDVFVSPDEARATGFGVARALEDVGLRAPVRRPYAAPEVVAGRGWGPEADRYAVAAIAYELLTGRRATGRGDEIIERLGSVYVGDEGALPALRDLFSWGLSDDPAGRPDRAVEFVTGLAEALGVEVIEPEPIAAPAAGAGRSQSPRSLVQAEAEAWSAEAGGAPSTPLDPADLYDDPAAIAGDGVEEESQWPDPTPVEEQPDAAADGGHGLPPAFGGEYADGPPPAESRFEDGRGGEAGEVDSQATFTSDDRDPLDDLEPIEDEEPLSLGGRVRAVLQASAAVVIGVFLAGAVYLMFGADVGVGGGEAEDPGDGVAFGETTASGPASGRGPAGLRTAGADPLSPRPASPAPEPGTVREPTSRDPVNAARLAAGAFPSAPDAERPAATGSLAPAANSNAERDSRPAPSAAQLGWLLVRTSPPGADVFVEGVDRGQAPLSLRDVPYGTHQIEIQAPGYEPHAREVTVSAEVTVAAVSVELTPGADPLPVSDLPPATDASDASDAPDATSPRTAVADAVESTVGSVFVESRPAGARVVIDGAPAGVTPIVVTDLRPGRREVRIENDGYRPWVTVVEVPPFDRIRVAASLEQARP